MECAMEQGPKLSVSSCGNDNVLSHAESSVFSLGSLMSATYYLPDSELLVASSLPVCVGHLLPTPLPQPTPPAFSSHLCLTVPIPTYSFFIYRQNLTVSVQKRRKK